MTERWRREEKVSKRCGASGQAHAADAPTTAHTSAAASRLMTAFRQRATSSDRSGQP